MRVLHVLTQLPQKTGSGVYFSNLIESMAQCGVENACIYGTDNAYKIKTKTNYDLPVLYNTKELPFNICGMSDEMPYPSTKYSDMTDEMIELLLCNFEEKLLILKEEFNPDIIISHHLFILTDLVRKIFPDKKVVGVCHGTDIRQILKNPQFLNRLPNINSLDMILTVNPAEHKDITNLFKINPDKIKFVGGGYNHNIFYPSQKERCDNSIKIMYAGKITASKGIYALAQTLPLLEKKYKNIEIHIVGASSKEQRNKLAAYSNFSPNLYVYNAENQKIMADHLRDTDIFILPSYFEALGLVAIEALACNKLVVTSEINGLRKLLGNDIIDSGVIEFTELPQIYDVDKPVEEELPAYVERLAENIEKQINRLNSNIFTPEIMNEIKRFSWQQIGKNILNKIVGY